MRLQIEQEIADLIEKQGATIIGTDKIDSIAETEEFGAN
jgi:hypothetical protein